MSSVIQSSIIRKVAMALSGIFLIFFLLQHFIINITSVFSESIFNQFSHFMGTNFVVQFIAQPILIFGVMFHFIMGFILDFKNRRSRNIKYVKFKGSSNSSWMSRNMIISGLVVLSFLGLHFYDFWIPEMNYKYVEFLPDDPNRYYTELTHKFEDVIKVIIYVISFGFLSLHLLGRIEVSHPLLYKLFYNFSNLNDFQYNPLFDGHNLFENYHLFLITKLFQLKP